MKAALAYRSLCVLLIVALIFSTAAFTKGGKKYFKEGIKLEATEKWDKAAEQFALALNEEPGNAEYLLHYRRALVNAALAWMDRGRHFEESRDWTSAYRAYAQAYSFDPTNEAALSRKKAMLDKQGIANRNGTPVSTEDQIKAKAEETVLGPDGKLLRPISGKQKKRPVVGDISYLKDTKMKQVIDSMAGSLNLNVIYDEGFRDGPIKTDFVLRGETTARALELFLLTNKLFYTQAGVRTIIVSQENGPNRQRYQQMFIKTFYIQNGDAAEIQKAIQAELGTKNMATTKGLNAIVVRETAANLQAIENLIASVDKTPAEVLIEVNMYEVAHNDMLQIGNQFATSGDNIPNLTTLGNLFGLKTTTTTTTNPTTGQTTTTTNPLFQGLTALIGPSIAIGVPPSTISFLQNKGKSKLVHSTQVRAFENEDSETKVGEKIPIQTAQIPIYGAVPTPTATPTGTNPGTTTQNPNLLAPNGASYPQIQYWDVGLVIKMKPKVTPAGDINLKMHIESTGVQNTNTLTPTITQRTMDGVAQTKDGQTSLIAGVLQTTSDEARSGMPFIGQVPILGYLFTTPTRQSTQTDIIVTVTPHILRSPTITKSDSAAVESGTQQEFGARVSIEDILYWADNYEPVTNDTVNDIIASDKQKTVPDNDSVDKMPTVGAPGRNSKPSDGNIENVSATLPIPNAYQIKNNNKTTSAESKSTEILPDEESSDTGDGNGPVTLSVRSNVSVAKIKQTIVVAIMVNGPADIVKARLTFNYNPDVLALRTIQDGGLFRQGGVNPDFNQSKSSGQVTVDINRPGDLGGVKASGQLFVLFFEAIANGSSDLTIDGDAELISPSGQQIKVNVIPGKVSAID